MITLFLLAVGAVVGAYLALKLVDYRAATEAGRQRYALFLAEQRIRDAQTEALNRLADAAGNAVYDATDSSRGRWPSKFEGHADIELRPSPEP